MSISVISKWLARGLLLAGLSLTTWGCAEQNAQSRPGERTQYSPQEVADMLDDNVVEVAATYHPFDPWMWTEDRGRPRGVVVRTLYLMGPHNKGVFGDGIIRPKLFVREEVGRGPWTLAKEWALDVDDALLFRSKRQTALGWGYSLYLPWDDVYKLGGKEIRMVVTFERRDGQTFTSGKKDFIVPLTE